MRDADRVPRRPAAKANRLKKRKVVLKDGRYLLLYEPKTRSLESEPGD